MFPNLSFVIPLFITKQWKKILRLLLLKLSVKNNKRKTFLPENSTLIVNLSDGKLFAAKESLDLNELPDFSLDQCWFDTCIRLCLPRSQIWCEDSTCWRRDARRSPVGYVLSHDRESLGWLLCLPSPTQPSREKFKLVHQNVVKLILRNFHVKCIAKTSQLINSQILRLIN